MMIPNIWKNKNMLQTTNQNNIYIYIYVRVFVCDIDHDFVW